MAFQLIFHPEAEDEYLKTYKWYEQEQKGLGERFEQQVEQKIKQILLHPENYGISKSGYRETMVEIFPYTIVYKFLKRKKIIYICAVYHAKRNPKTKYRK